MHTCHCQSWGGDAQVTGEVTQGGSARWSVSWEGMMLGQWSLGWAGRGQVCRQRCELTSARLPRHRYTVLTGTPPFAAAPLSEMYRHILEGHYPEPAHLSPSARSLIARLLAPDPAERPSLDHVLQDDFFTQVRGCPPGEPLGTRDRLDPGLIPAH